MSDVLSRSGVFSPRALQFSTGGSPGKACLARSVSVRSSLPAKPLLRSSLGGDSQGRKVAGWVEKSVARKLPEPARVQMALRFPKAVQWWEKDLQPNMEAVRCSQQLVDSLVTAGNKLVIVDFFSPGCGGCRALHPKICQFAETNPDVLFLQINHEENKSMCYSLNVHVLPFFRFYRGAQGRLCSFSCTNATIKKFKDALAKHSTDRCSLGPAKGLEESELMALAANKDLNFTHPEKKSEHANPEHVALPPGPVPGVPFLPAKPRPSHGAGEKAVVGAGR